MAVAPDELLASLQRGDDEAFRRVAATEMEGLYFLAYRLLGSRVEAEDACQEVLLRLYRAAPSLRSGVFLRAWLRRVCVNYCLNLRRHAARRPPVDQMETLAEQVAAPGGTEQEVAAAAFSAAVAQALEQLSPRQRTVFVLRHYQGCSTREAAEAMGCAEGTVKVQFSRATARLRALLQEWSEVGGEGVGDGTL